MALVSACTGSGMPPAANPPGPHWKLVYRDSFVGDHLEGRRWATCYWWSSEGCTNLANDEREWYTSRQVSVAGGTLRMTAKPQTSRHLGRTFSYASGMVSSGRTGNDLTSD